MLRTSHGSRLLRVLSLLALNGFPALACAPANRDDDGDAHAATEAIVGGTPFPVAQVTFVDINSARRCSGTLVRNDWVLTSMDCGAVPGAAVRRIDGASTVDYVMNEPSGVAGQRDALLHLAKPLPVNGVSAGYTRALRPSMLALGQSVRCFGYGAGEGGGAAGTLRYAFFKVAAVIDGVYRLVPTTSGQSLSAADQGAGCLDDAGMIAAIVLYPENAAANAMATSLIDPWIEGAIAGAWIDRATPGHPISEMGAPSFVSGDTLVTAYVTHDNRLYSRRRTGDVETFLDLGAAVGQPSVTDRPAAFRSADGVEHVVAPLYPPTLMDVTRASNGAYRVRSLLATSTNLWGPPAALVDATGANHLYAVAGGHVQELTWAGDGAVTQVDVTLQANAPPASARFVAAYAFGSERHVVYQDDGDHVHELASAGPAWSDTDLTAVTNGPSERNPLDAYASPTEQGVVVRAPDASVWLFWRSLSKPWTAMNLTSMTGAPLARITSQYAGPVGVYDPADGHHHVVYTGIDHHVWELSGTPGGPFHASDLTRASGALINGGWGDLNVLVVPADHSRHVFYVENQFHELRTPRL